MKLLFDIESNLYRLVCLVRYACVYACILIFCRQKDLCYVTGQDMAILFALWTGEVFWQGDLVKEHALRRKKKNSIFSWVILYYLLLMRYMNWGICLLGCFAFGLRVFWEDDFSDLWSMDILWEGYKKLQSFTPMIFQSMIVNTVTIAIKKIKIPVRIRNISFQWLSFEYHKRVGRETFLHKVKSTTKMNYMTLHLTFSLVVFRSTCNNVSRPIAWCHPRIQILALPLIET